MPDFKSKLLPSDKEFADYSRNRLNCLGRILVQAKLGKTVRKLYLYVIEGKYESLFGREWIREFVNEIDWNAIFQPQTIHTVSTSLTSLTSIQSAQLEQLLAKHENVFGETAGKLLGPPVKMHLKPRSSPVFAKAREIPFALRDAYAKEIDAKIASGLYERVECSEWASTTHVVTKKNGKIRITGNYKPTLNPRLIIDEHPIPKPEHLFQKTGGAKIFCLLDVTDAYSHLIVDEEFSHALTLNTPTHGLIRPKRAVYGAANIPAIWQRTMENLLRDFENVISFFDDILLFAETYEELLLLLDKVLERLKKRGIRLNRAKCVFAASSVEFLGHKIDAQGLHKSDKHIEAVRDAPKPVTPEQLELFLGKATYYNAFIPNLSTLARPLRDVLIAESFKWTPAADKAYEDIKKILTSPQVLMLYDPKLPLLLATDASRVGLGAVLSHRLSNGTERPIAYASRTLTETEQRYPQIDKEALSIVWAVNKFFMYLYARQFELITDHKPLTQILHPEKSLPVLCISRMANYADYLSHFNYTVSYKNTKENSNADYCSRAPLPTTVDTLHQISLEEGEEMPLGDGFDLFILKQIKQLPVRADMIARETRKDHHLGKIFQLLESGVSLSRHGFKPPESNYTISFNCLVFEHRVVIPEIFRRNILNDLHVAHLGIVKMKALARSFVYWPGIYADIEKIAKSCAECAQHAHARPKFSNHHWEYPKGPWQRVHIDYAGPVGDMMLLIVVDAYSKWVEVKVTNSTTSLATICILDDLFASYGVPVTLVSDNAQQFVSEEFEEFLKVSGVKYHKLSAPYHPATNGQAERYVQTVKDSLYKMKTSKNTLRRDINEFLRQYRKAPHVTTGLAPAQLFLGRNIRTRLDLVRPTDTQTRVSEKQQADFVPSYRIFHPEESIYFLSGNPRMEKWIPGRIVARLGDLHYEIDYLGKKFKRHINQIRKFGTRNENEEPVKPEVLLNPAQNKSPPPRRVHFFEKVHDSRNAPNPPATGQQVIGDVPRNRNLQEFISPEVQQYPPIDQQPISPEHRVVRRSSRARKEPQRYSPS